MSGSTDSSVKLWDLESGSKTPLDSLTGFKDTVSEIQSNEDQIIVGSLDGIL